MTFVDEIGFEKVQLRQPQLLHTIQKDKWLLNNIKFERNIM